MGHCSQANRHHPWSIHVISPWVQPQLLLNLIQVVAIGAFFDQQPLCTQILIVFLGIWMVREDPLVPFSLLRINEQVLSVLQVLDDSN